MNNTFTNDAKESLCVPKVVELLNKTTKASTSALTCPSAVTATRIHRATGNIDSDTDDMDYSYSTNRFRCTTTDLPEYYVPSYDQDDCPNYVNGQHNGSVNNGGEARFLITSTWKCFFKRRNRIPHLPPITLRYNQNYSIYNYNTKPITLQSLDDTIYYQLVYDLQCTLRYKCKFFLLFWLPFCLCAFTSSILFTLSIQQQIEDDQIDDYFDNSTSLTTTAPYKWRRIFIVVVISYMIGTILYHIRLRNVEEQIHVRVQEWLPILERYNYAINYVIDDPQNNNNIWCSCWSDKETYVRIYSINYNRPPTAPLPPQIHHPIEDENNNSICSYTNDFVHTKPLQGNSNNDIQTITSKESTDCKQQQKCIGNSGSNSAKYFIFYPMELVRRNIDARHIGYHHLFSDASCMDCHSNSCGTTGSSSTSTSAIIYYVTPPTLLLLPQQSDDSDISDDAIALLLGDCLRDLEIKTTPSFTIRMIVFVCLFVFFIVVTITAMVRYDKNSSSGGTNNASFDALDGMDDLDGTFALFSLLFILYIVDRFLRLYTNLYNYYQFFIHNDISKYIESQWLPLFQQYGYTITYHIDKPHWYSWREDYVHISRKI